MPSNNWGMHFSHILYLSCKFNLPTCTMPADLRRLVVFAFASILTLAACDGAAELDAPSPATDAAASDSARLFLQPLPMDSPEAVVEAARIGNALMAQAERWKSGLPREVAVEPIRRALADENQAQRLLAPPATTERSVGDPVISMPERGRFYIGVSDFQASAAYPESVDWPRALAVYVNGVLDDIRPLPNDETMWLIYELDLPEGYFVEYEILTQTPPGTPDVPSARFIAELEGTYFGDWRYNGLIVQQNTYGETVYTHGLHVQHVPPLFDTRFVPTPGGLEHGERGVPAIRFLDDEARDLTMPARTWLRLTMPPDHFGTDGAIYYEKQGATYGPYDSAWWTLDQFEAGAMYFEAIEGGGPATRSGGEPVRVPLAVVFNAYADGSFDPWFAPMPPLPLDPEAPHPYLAVSHAVVGKRVEHPPATKAEIGDLMVAACPNEPPSQVRNEGYHFQASIRKSLNSFVNSGRMSAGRSSLNAPGRYFYPDRIDMTYGEINPIYSDLLPPDAHAENLEDIKTGQTVEGYITDMLEAKFSETPGASNVLKSEQYENHMDKLALLYDHAPEGTVRKWAPMYIVASAHQGSINSFGNHHRDTRIKTAALIRRVGLMHIRVTRSSTGEFFVEGDVIGHPPSLDVLWWDISHDWQIPFAVECTAEGIRSN